MKNIDESPVKFYPYQTYYNDYIKKNAQKCALPPIHIFERQGFAEYQPVQGEIHIINND